MMTQNTSRITAGLCLLILIASLVLFIFHVYRILEAPPSIMRDLIGIQNRVDRLLRTPFNQWKVAHEKPLYFFLLILTRLAGLDVRVVNILLSVLVAGGLMLVVSEIAGWPSALLGGSLFFASPFVLSETTVYTTHTHLGLAFAIFAMWLFAKDSKKLLVSSVLFGILCGAGVLSSLHSLLIIFPLALFQSVRLLKRKRYLAVILMVAAASAVWVGLESVYWITASGTWLSRVRPFIAENMYSFSLLPPAYSMPVFMGYEVENGCFSILVLLFFAGSAAAFFSGKIEKRETAGWLLAVSIAGLIIFEFSGIEKIDRVYYPVWVATLGVSPVGLFSLFRSIRGRDYRYVIPILTLGVLIVFCTPQNQRIVSTCRAGSDIFPTKESRRGVYSADCGWIPLNLPRTNGVSLPAAARFVIVRKYIPPWEWLVIDEEIKKLPEQADWSHIYDRLRNQPAAAKINSLESMSHFFYVNSDLYAAYRAGLVSPVPSLVVPIELFKATRAEFGLRQRPLGAILRGSHDNRQ